MAGLSLVIARTDASDRNRGPPGMNIDPKRARSRGGEDSEGRVRQTAADDELYISPSVPSAGVPRTRAIRA